MDFIDAVKEYWGLIAAVAVGFAWLIRLEFNVVALKVSSAKSEGRIEQMDKDHDKDQLHIVDRLARIETKLDALSK